MEGNAGERVSDEQLRHIITSYLDEVLHCYQEQELWLEDSARKFDRLEQKASELLKAMMTSGEPGERRRAILQVMCRTNTDFRGEASVGHLNP